MTISTISLGVGLNNLGAKRSHLVDPHNDPRQSSTGGNTPPTVLNGAAHVPTQAHAIEPRVTPVIVNGSGQSLKFSTNPQTGTPIITVIDTDTGEVVRQIPAEQALDFMRQLENDKGALLSVKL